MPLVWFLVAIKGSNIALLEYTRQVVTLIPARKTVLWVTSTA